MYGGASYAQTAQQLGISVKSVDNALQRARRKLHAEGIVQ
ncbi:MAG: sigma factor-like helix-turn-helix DNA-binding protein [Ruminococcus sp.]